MKISKQWLSDYIDLSDVDDAQFAELITTRVAEVDEVHVAAAPLATAILAEIVAHEPHPERDSLSVATVDLGGTQVRVVCAAPNCRPGLFTAYVPPGGTIAVEGGENGLRSVSERSFGSVQSVGVLASERELGLSAEHEGILELTAEYVQGAFRGPSGESPLRAGTPLAALLGGPDTVLEIDNKSLTHRPDLWGHYGFARELHAILARDLKDNLDRFADDSDAGRRALAELGSGGREWKIDIEKGCGCRRFAGLQISGISNHRSPLWLRRRLYAIGAGVRNLIVDLSNYVMHDVGQPNHTYDAAKVSAQHFKISLAKDDEGFKALDGEQYLLSSQDIVVRDAKACIGLAGIMGGESSSISNATADIFLEAANWDPVRVRKTSLRLALRTDASNRFEKSLSPHLVPVALQQFCRLLREIQPSVSAVGSVVDNYPEVQPAITVPIHSEYVRARLGHEVSDQQIASILEALGFTYLNEHELLVPYYRATRDVSIEDDIVEEVGRTIGYQEITPQAPKIESVAEEPRPLQKFEHQVRDFVAANGFSEVYLYSFMSSSKAAELGYAEREAGSEFIRLENPVDAGQDVMRTTLVPGMLDCVSKNARHADRILLFEVGRAYGKTQSAVHCALASASATSSQPAQERRLLTLAYSSGLDEKHERIDSRPPVTTGSDFYSLAGMLKKLIQRSCFREATLHAAVSETAATDDAAMPWRFEPRRQWMHPQRAAFISVADTCVGHIAEVQPRFSGECRNRTVLAELDLELLLQAAAERESYRPFSRFPASFFEMSVIMPEREQFAHLDTVLRTAVPAEQLRAIDTLAVYQGTPIPEGQKSVSVRLSFGLEDGTLSSEALAALQQACMQAVEKSGFSLRR